MSEKKVLVTKKILTDVATTIREREGSSELIKPVDFASHIASMKGGIGGGLPLINITGAALPEIPDPDSAYFELASGSIKEGTGLGVSLGSEWVDITTSGLPAVPDDNTFYYDTTSGKTYLGSQEISDLTLCGVADIKNLYIGSQLVYKMALLPVNLGNVDLDNLTKIVQSGEARNFLNLGDELSIPYNGATIPMVVAGFADATVKQASGDAVVPAIQLIMKYCASGTTAWGANGTTVYSGSTLKTFIDSQIQPKFSEDFLACLGETKVQFCNRSNGADVSYCKLFAPSMAELGVTNASYNTAQQAAIEGPAFELYQGASDGQRIRNAIDATGTAQIHWTRSFYSGNSNAFGCVFTSGAPSCNYYDSTYRAVASCNFIGQS